MNLGVYSSEFGIRNIDEQYLIRALPVNLKRVFLEVYSNRFQGMMLKVLVFQEWTVKRLVYHSMIILMETIGLLQY